jgi:hypothetical protein
VPLSPAPRVLEDDAVPPGIDAGALENTGARLLKGGKVGCRGGNGRCDGPKPRCPLGWASSLQWD